MIELCSANAYDLSTVMPVALGERGGRGCG